MNNIKVGHKEIGFNPLNYSCYLMYHLIKHKKRILPFHCIKISHMIIRINSNYFPKQRHSVDLHSAEIFCFTLEELDI
jgi:hypothetical protein